MNKYMMMLVAAGLMVAPVMAKAEDHAADHAAPAAEAAAEAPATAAVEKELADGTKVSVEGDAVSIVAADGTKTAAPDGEHALKDGTTITVKDGKIVK